MKGTCVASKYEQFREQMKELGCSKIDSVSDSQIDSFLLSFSIALGDVAVAVRNSIVEAAAFAQAIGAYDDEDDSGVKDGHEHCNPGGGQEEQLNG